MAGFPAAIHSEKLVTGGFSSLPAQAANKNQYDFGHFHLIAPKHFNYK